MKIKDLRIDRNNNVKGYLALAQEYLDKIGRRLSGGWEMTWTEFKTQSYRRTYGDTEINVIIRYEEQTIEITEFK